MEARNRICADRPQHTVPTGNRGELDRAQYHAGAGAAVAEAVACDVARMVTIPKVLRHLRLWVRHAIAKRRCSDGNRRARAGRTAWSAS